MLYPGFATLLRELDSSFTPSEQGAQKYQQKEVDGYNNDFKLLPLFSKCFWFKQMGVSFVPYLENLAMQASSCSVEVDYFSVILFGLAESDFWGHAPTWFFSLQGQKGAVHRAHVIIEVAWPWTTHLLQVLFLEVFAFKASDDKLWLGRVYVFPFLNLCRQT